MIEITLIRCTKMLVFGRRDLKSDSRELLQVCTVMKVESNRQDVLVSRAAKTSVCGRCAVLHGKARGDATMGLAADLLPTAQDFRTSKRTPGVTL